MLNQFLLQGHLRCKTTTRSGRDKNSSRLGWPIATIAAAFSSAYVVSGGLSQSTVNDKSGAKIPLSLIICSLTLGIILLYFTYYLRNLPEVILAVIVLHAVSSLIKIKELKKLRRLDQMEFFVAILAFLAVLIFGILKGVIISVLISLILLIQRTSNPQVANLGRIGNTKQFSDIKRHPDNIKIPGALILRIQSSILYFNAGNILEKINLHLIEESPGLNLLVLDLSAAPYVDVAGSKMLLNVAASLKKEGKQIRIVNALSNVRETLRKQGLEDMTGHISRSATIVEMLSSARPN